MANLQIDAGFRRREVFRFAAVAGMALWAEAYALAASDFWNKKKPAEWTEQEIQELRTKSPWAKKVDAEMSGGSGGGRGGGAGGGGGEEGGSGGGGGGGGRGGGRGGGNVAPAANFGGQAPSLEVVWQSAKPVQDAHPIKLPARLDGHYVISVTGLPAQVVNASMTGRGGGRGGSGGRMGGGGRTGGGGSDAGGFAGGQAAAGPAPGPAEADAINGGGPPPPPADPTAGLRRGTTLNVKGKAPQNADVVMAMNNNATILFGFLKDSLPLTIADKEVEFDIKLGGLSAKAKFTLKDMMYNEELAV